MQPYEAYQLFSALKLHFESDGYDAVKYCFKTSARPTAFNKRKDRFFFAKLAKKYPSEQELKNFLVANFVHADSALWSGQLVDEDANQKYLKWRKIHEAQFHAYVDDLSTANRLCEKVGIRFDEMLTVTKNHQMPPLVTWWAEGKISYETIVILDILTGFMERASKEMTETIFWPSFARKIKKYRSFFLTLDRKKYRDATLSAFGSG